MRTSLVDKIIIAASEVQLARDALGEKMSNLEALVGKRRSRAISMRQISDLAIGPSPSARQRKRRKKAAEQQVEKPLNGFVGHRAKKAYERIYGVIDQNNGRASIDDIRNTPGVSNKNLSRLLAGMVEKGMLKTTYGGKYRRGEGVDANAPN